MKRIECSSPCNLVVWPLVLLALVEPIGLVLIVLARHGAGLHHRAHFVVLVLKVELVPGASIHHPIIRLHDYYGFDDIQNNSLPLQSAEVTSVSRGSLPFLKSINRMNRCQKL